MSIDDPLVIELQFVDNGKVACRTPSTRIDGRCLVVAFDENNVVVADLERGVAHGTLSTSLLKHEMCLRYYVLEAVALSMISALRAVALHGACVAWKGRGVLLCGESGAGKTSLAYACAKNGWDYVSDDASYLLLGGEGTRVYGNCHQVRFRDASRSLFAELEGKEVSIRVAGKPSIEVDTSELVDVQSASCAELRSIVFLSRRSDAVPGLRHFLYRDADAYFRRFLLLPAIDGSRTDKALRRLLNVATFELTYQDLDWAVRLLSGEMEKLCYV